MTVAIDRLRHVLDTRHLLLDAGSDFDALSAAVTERCMATLPETQGAAVLLWGEGELRLHHAQGSLAANVGARLPGNGSLTALALRGGKPLMSANVGHETSVNRSCYQSAGIRSVLTVPLVGPEGPIGALAATSSLEAAFDRADLVVAEMLAGDFLQALSSPPISLQASAIDTMVPPVERIAEALPQYIWTMKDDGRITYRNRALRHAASDQSPTTIWESLARQVHADDRADVAEMIRATLHDRLPGEIEFRRILPDGSTRWRRVEIVAGPSDRGDAREWIGVSIDIEDQKHREIALETTVRGKDTLLYEVNHRVKNSLQVATSLLAIQSGKIRDPEARRRLSEARAQISTIAKIHHATYRAGRHDRVDLSTFLRELADGLVAAPRYSAVALTVTAPETLPFPLDRAVSVSLILVELITNALKHALEQREGHIHVDVSASTERVILEVRDDGPGLPKEISGTHGIGLELVRDLAEQLRGRLEIMDVSRGAGFRVDVPRA